MMARYDERNDQAPRKFRKKKKSKKVPFLSFFIICAASLIFICGYFYLGGGEKLLSGLGIGNTPAGAGNMAVQSLSVEIAAQNACVAELESGAMIFQKAHVEKIAPASTAKLLTALTALDYCYADETVTAGQEVWFAAADASKAWLNAGDSLSMRQLLTAMLLPSGGDAAYTTAVYTGRKIAGAEASEQQALDAFMAAMNQKAKDLGATSSNFVTPDGYDAEGQYTTAADLARIAKGCFGSETVMDIVGRYSAYDVWLSGQEVTFYNTNALLNPDSAHYYPGAVGLKTGNSADAGSCLVSAAVIDGRTYITVVMGSGEDSRFEDTRRLYANIEEQSGSSAA